MNRFDALRKLNPVLVVLSFVQAATGGIFLLAPFDFNDPSAGPLYYVHRINGVLLVVLIVVHVVLNWGWIKANVFKRSGARAPR